MTASSPFSIANVRKFIAFRVFFNARFYYPVFTILFLDFGLTIEQFALLNTVWAITIVVAEVPSGALADVLGRRALLIATSLLMVFEMAVLSFVPLGNSWLIFLAFLVNRVLSGLAEAMASGADEAIAYDSLVEQGDPEDWPRVLSMQMRLRSIGSILTMTIGALIYDPGVVNRCLSFLGTELVLTQQDTMRFPIYLTLLLGILATITAIGMVEERPTESGPEKRGIIGPLRVTLSAGRWIFSTPFALTIILIGMCYDHTLRMVVTMTSQYFRLIDLPEASFGIIGSAMALLGLITPKIAEKMAIKNSPLVNMLWVLLLSLVGLGGLVPFTPYWGLLPIACIFTAMMFVSFFTSHYLNKITDSSQRATVLSFKGLAFNLAYGTIGVFFAMLMSQLRGSIKLADAAATSSFIEDESFRQAISYFPTYLLACLFVTMVFCHWRLKKTGDTAWKQL